MNTKNIEALIEEAWDKVEIGKNKKAIFILEQAMKDFPEHRELILLQLAQIYFRNREELKALELFGICYNKYKDQEVLDFLLYCYYDPNIEEYKARFYRNKEYIEDYKYFYGSIPELINIKEKVLWNGKKQIVYYDNNEISKLEIKIFNDNLGNNEILLINEWSIDAILNYEKITQKQLNCLTAEAPMYLYYDEHIFSIVIQLIEFEEIIKKNRIVIIVGEKQLEEFFDDTQVILPDYIIGSNVNKYINIIDVTSEKKLEYFDKCKKEVNQYYKQNSLKILENIKNKNPKILFMTSRFTTILQYHARDCMEASKEMGLETCLSIEKSDVHRSPPVYELDLLYRFKPDIIFCLDHFKFEHNYIPNEIVWITWVQDPLSHIMDKNTPGKLSDRDFVLSHYITWKEFKNLNYPEERLIDAPVPANHEIYRIYSITEEEKEKYSCDICFVCHAANFEEELEEFLRRFNDSDLEECLRKMAYEYYEVANTTGKLYYSKAEFKEFFLELLDRWEDSVEDHMLNIFVEEVYMWLNQRLFRQILVNWLIEAGYNNIKLWGNGWIKHEKYKKYAMGPAKNGEQLSKIYQCSKINVGNNIVTTAAARAWESMLSGGFYMSNYIPEENDMSDIRKILKEDEFVMFYSKEDFLSKIKYYLEHEEERLKMIKIGKKCALERMTFKALMKKTINNISEYYKKGIQNGR